MKRNYSHYKILFILLIVFVAGHAQKTNFPFQDATLQPDARVSDLVSRLTLEEKVAQMQDVAPAIPRLGIPQYNWWNECLHGVARAGAATSFPQAIGMAATWNTDLMYDVAQVISTEARAKFNRAVALGQRNRYQGLTMWTPNINIFRDPRWGRGQETYGEDPYLTSRLAVSFVSGLQGDDPLYFKVIATPKHFAVHSGPEYNRHSFDAYTDQRDLWETYLPAFKAAIVEAKAFSVMSAYNRYLGASATASKLLLTDILRDQWGFKGYVVSDCGAVSDIYSFHKLVDTPEEAAALAVKAGCDLNCGSTYIHLVKAVKDGLIEEKELDIALKRLFLARVKLGLLNADNKMPFSNITTADLESEVHQDLALKTAQESLVLLKNDELLPLSKDLSTITVIGPNAADRHFGLGNYFGTPSHLKTLLQGIEAKVSEETKVHYFKGTNIADTKPIFDVVPASMFKKEVQASYFSNTTHAGKVVAKEKKDQIDFEWGGAAPVEEVVPGNFSIRYAGILKPDLSGEFDFGVIESGGEFKLIIDGETVLTGAKGNGNEVLTKRLKLEQGKEYKLVLDYSCNNPWMASVQLVWNKEELEGKEALAQAVKESDVVIFVAGISARLEGEEMPVKIDGFDRGDRTHLKLPKNQSDLLKEIVTLGRPVVLVTTSGSALSLNWENEHIPAILQIWYPGQAGNAVADVLFGDVNPSGRLPVTFYESVDDLPPFENYQMKGRTYKYFVGSVLYPFGYGLSYTDFTYSKPILESSIMNKDAKNTVSVEISNDGYMNGATVVQLYVTDIEASVPRPIKSLRKFKKVFIGMGETKRVSFEISAEDLAVRDNNGKSFVESGKFMITVGKHSESSNYALLTVE